MQALVRIELFAGLLLIAAAAEAQDSTGIEFFETRIRPVLAENCYSCHGADATPLQGALRVDSRAALLSGGNGGPAIVPGKPERSLLMRALRHEDELKMPPWGKLADEDIARIEEWIRIGAPAPADETEWVATIPDVEHWAFQPLSDQRPPTSTNSWARSSIDAFVAQRLREAQLTPSSDVGKRSLMRRAYFDLVGMPPSADDIDAFVGDASPGAYEQVIDGLLRSEHFGERWARYWLDIVRYSDEGFQARAFPIAWTYRDWVIDAFNADMPYDEFVERQLAADLLDDDVRHLPALGMLTVGINLPRITDVPENLDDRIDVVSRGFLGLSVACARCHDHKFDPIPQKDYYSLYSVFLNSPDVLEPVAIDTIPDTPQAEFYTKKLRYRREWIDRFKRERLEYHKGEFRKIDAIERYLAAAWVGRNTSDIQLDALSKEKNLNLYVLTRWRRFLVDSLDAADGRFQPIVDADGSDEAIAEFARRLVDASRDSPWGDPAKEQLRQILWSDGAPTEIPFEDSMWVLNEGDQNTVKNLRWEYTGIFADWGYRGGPRHAMAVRDATERQQAFVFVRGNQHSLGTPVEPRFLTAFGATPFREGSGRLELAQAITNPDNPLPARVMVNRVWQHLFGHGIVRTPSDFGLRGDPPSHPELLDYLATKFINDGWSVKKLIREIMLSSTYRQASADTPEGMAVDPENRLLWRQNRRRLDFEALRDSMLTVADALDATVGGGPFALDARPSPTRRSIYAYISREEPSATMRNFDFSNPEQHTPQRESTTVPQQALFLINNSFVGEQARRLAARLPESADVAKANELYRFVLGRVPTERELELAVEFVTQGDTSPRVTSETSPWRYGSAELDVAGQQVNEFNPFKVWVDERWQHASILPAAIGGRASLSASGGSPGDDLQSVVVRRWVSPIAARIKITGVLNHPMGATPERFDYSNGIRGWVVSDRQGVLASLTARGFKVSTDIDGLLVERGEIIDFVVDSRGDYEMDDFNWAPSIEQLLSDEEKESGMATQSWSAQDDFRQPETLPLTSWERLAQVLLMTNEFAFVD